MILYWIVTGLLLLFLLILLLIYSGLIFKNSKIYTVLKSTLFHCALKKITFSIFTLFIIIITIFLLTSLLPDYQQSSSKETLFSYLYNILPIPKKVCTSTSLENSTLICSTYKYTLIDFKESSIYIKNTPVLSIIKEKCSVSFTVGIIAYLIQSMIGYPLGIYLAKKENKIADKAFNSLNNIIRIIPPVIYFYLFVLLFMVIFRLPVLFEINSPITYVAPLCAITLSSSLSIAYFVKKYVSLELNKDYVTFAKSKGLDNNTILYKHVIRNALIPFLRTVPASILLCFSGFYFLEASFNIPGAGLTLIHAIQLKDVYLIRGLIIFFSALSILAFLIGDLLTLILGRKVEYRKEKINHEQ